MQVYNAYFKIIKNHLPSIMLYLVVFLVLAVIMASIFGSGGALTDFTKIKSKVAVFNMDNSPLSGGLYDYIAENSELVKLPDIPQDIEDALFYDHVSYVLRIPQGFAESFISGKNDVSLKKMSRSGTSGSVYMDFLVERYLNMASLYVKNSPGMAESLIVENVAKDLQKTAAVEMKNYDKPSVSSNITYYFRFLAYSIMAVMLMGVTSFMMAFNKKDLNNRILCSPLKPVNMNLQIVLGNVTFAVAAWVILLASVFLLDGRTSFGTDIALLCINSLAYTVAALSIGFLAGKFIKSEGVQAAVTNVFTLGLSFLSGVFVGQEFLGKTVLDIARFTPVYWYVKAVDDIQKTVEFTAQTTAPIVNSILIQLGFAAAILIVALAVTKQKRKSAA